MTTRGVLGGDREAVAWHVAPTDCQGSIQANGLDPWLSGDYDRAEYGLMDHPGNWLWSSFEQAQGYVRPGLDDVWEVRLDALDVVEDHMNDTPVTVVYATIPPAHLRLVTPNGRPAT